MIEFYDYERGVVPTRKTNGLIVIIVLHFSGVCIAPGGGAAVGGSLRSSLSGSRPTSHSQGHGRPCLPRPHLRPRFHKTWMERFSKQLPQATKKRPGNTPRSLKNVRATETATDVSVLPREMSRSDRGVRDREALSVFQNSSRRRKKETEEYSPISKKRASEGTRTHTHEGTRS